MRRDRSRASLTGSPLTAVMMSPCLMPALSPGEPDCGETTRAPLASERPSDSAMSLLTGWICTPSQPRSTLPSFCRSAITSLATDAGMAKAMPTLPPEGEKMAVLMPTTSPLRLKAGPPELPRFTAASICR